MAAVLICSTCGREAHVADGYRVCGPCDLTEDECECDPSLLYVRTKAQQRTVEILERIERRLRRLEERAR